MFLATADCMPVKGLVVPRSSDTVVAPAEAAESCLAVAPAVDTAALGSSLGCGGGAWAGGGEGDGAGVEGAGGAAADEEAPADGEQFRVGVPGLGGLAWWIRVDTWHLQRCGGGGEGGGGGGRPCCIWQAFRWCARSHILAKTRWF